MKSTPKVRQVNAKDGVRRVSLTRRWRSKRALRSAQLLDEVVDTQLPLLASFDEERRRRSADYLAELVALAQDYRYYANGWIDSRELDRRGQRTMNRLARMREESSARLITD